MMGGAALDTLGGDDEALALILTLDQAELAWLVDEFERRVATTPGRATEAEPDLLRAWGLYARRRR